MAKGKKKVSWVLIIAVMFLLGGIMALIEKIKESAHPALFAVLLVVGLVAVAVCVFLILRHAKKKKDAAVSPSPRRAWIEIESVSYTLANCSGRPPHGGRGLKCF